MVTASSTRGTDTGKRIPTVSDKIIRRIMEAEYQGYRDALREYAPQFPLMDDATFLEQLHTIIPERCSIVTGKQAAAIYRLRAEYQRIPPGEHGYKPIYNDMTVRLQNRAGKLSPLTSEELWNNLGTNTLQEHWYRLIDVLHMSLGRWPAPKRNINKAAVLKWWNIKEPEEANNESQTTQGTL